MIAYCYDAEGRYVGSQAAQVDPRATARNGHPVYLLPASATWEEPPEYDPETEIAVWDRGAWTVEALPEEPEPEPEPEAEAEPAPTITERVASLEATKAERADVDELQEALDMILTGVTE